jgi:hypothetical protein
LSAPASMVLKEDVWHASETIHSIRLSSSGQYLYKIALVIQSFEERYNP